MSDTTVSVIIPAFNAESFLAEAIDSVLNQTRKATEILVIDDGSVDRTGAIAQSYADQGVRYLRQEHAGYVAALNLGLHATSGMCVAFLDADDLWTENKLSLQMGHLESDPSAEVALGHLQRMWKPSGSQEWSYRSPELGLALTAVVVRRSVFENTGYFDSKMSHGADWDWFFRARERGTRFVTHPEVTMFYRRHDANMSTDFDAGHKATVDLVKRSLDRRRLHTGRADSLPAVTLAGC